MNREHISNFAFGAAIVAAAVSTNTTTNGAWIDTKGYGSLGFDMFTNAYTDGTFTPLIEEADEDDKSDAAAAADSALTGAEANAAIAAAGASKIGYIGTKRYVRLSLVSTGTSSGATVGARYQLGNPDVAPVA